MYQHIYCSYNIYFLGKKFISLGVQMDLKILYNICIKLAYFFIQYSITFILLIGVNKKYCFLIKGANHERYFLTVNSAELSVYT